jgi:NodT family efflux transporter outer membrane factor (OMF) lipoprotein
VTASRIAIVAGLALLAGCTVGPDYRTPATAMPDAFFDAVAAVRDAIAPPSAAPAKAVKPSPVPPELAHWWRALGDPELDALVDRAIAGNLDLKIALARLQEARTAEAGTIALALPDIAAAGAAGRGSGSDITRGRVPSTLTSATDTTGLRQINQVGGFDANWELDLFGKYRREIEAAHGETQAAAAARNLVLISVVGDVVRAYVDLRGLQTRLAILRRNIDAENRLLAVVQERFDRGLTNELDVALAGRELATLQAAVAPLAAQIDAAAAALGVLTGAMPQSLARELVAPELIPPIPDKIASGLPLDLLRRRPDIREAERELAAATARIGVATADLFPHVVLSAAAGGQGQGLGISPASGGFIWAVGPGAYWDVLDFGRLDALVEIADLRTQEQLAAYRATVLRAVQEVDDDIGDFAAQQDSLRNLDVAIVAAQQSLSLAQSRYDRGLTDFLNVLDAERQEFDLEDRYAVAQQNAAEDFVALYKALGGGWEDYQAIPPIREPQPAIVAAFRALFDPPPAPAAGK